jgi:hypothetical protein
MLNFVVLATALPRDHNFSPCSCDPNDSPADCTALCDLLAAGNGPLRALGFGNGSSVCSWGVQTGNYYTGVSCDATRRPVSLVLEHAGLSGSVPSSIGHLTNLRKLSLWHNALHGALPDSIGELHALTSLNLDNNQLSSTIPATIGRLVQLTGLGLSNNAFTGSIPSELALLSSLQVMCRRRHSAPYKS